MSIAAVMVGALRVKYQMVDENKSNYIGYAADTLLDHFFWNLVYTVNQASFIYASRKY